MKPLKVWHLKKILANGLLLARRILEEGRNVVQFIKINFKPPSLSEIYFSAVISAPAHTNSELSAKKSCPNKKDLSIMLLQFSLPPQPSTSPRRAGIAALAPQHLAV